MAFYGRSGGLAPQFTLRIGQSRPSSGIPAVSGERLVTDQCSPTVFIMGILFVAFLAFRGRRIGLYTGNAAQIAGSATTRADMNRLNCTTSPASSVYSGSCLGSRASMPALERNLSDPLLRNAHSRWRSKETNEHSTLV